MNILDNFRLANEKEAYNKVGDIIEDGIDFKGTNLWVLIFAIFIASLGLNVNSTAVVIGAMLISPLMGPIMGLGFGMAVNDLSLLKKSLSSYLFSAGIGLTTSTIFFLLSPINDAHSEILARTSPNIYDVLIAFFGGLAGMLATSSKLKGNVIPGVAIATALMPPLCTAGYGLATFQFEFFFGASYLFLINTVFIALATLITARFLKFPFKQLLQKEDEVKAKRVVGVIVAVTLLPSMYFGYDIVQQNKYMQKATSFIENEAVFPNDYLLKRTINPKSKSITLTYGGAPIEKDQIEALKSKLTYYDLDNTALEIRQGFAYMQDNKEENQLSLALTEKQQDIQNLQKKLDSLAVQDELSKQVYNELKAQYPTIQSFILQQTINNTDTLRQPIWVAIIHSKTKWEESDKRKVSDWLKVRIKNDRLKIYLDEQNE